MNGFESILTRSTAALIALCFLSQHSEAATALPQWQRELTSPKPGSFPLPQEMKLHYRIGWASLPAATADFSFSRPRPGVLLTEGHGGTQGMVRGLWKLDASYSGRANAETLRPIGFKQLESYRSEAKHTETSFTDKDVSRRRYTTPTDPTIPKKKRMAFPFLHDLDSAFFFLRSQRLANGDSYKLVVFPQTTPYLATVTVKGREDLTVKAGSFRAIACDLKLQEVDSTQKLIPHQKFKQATLWVSDDKNRIPLKVESEIFVGSVWLELVGQEVKSGSSFARNQTRDKESLR